MPSREIQHPQRKLSQFLGRELLYDYFQKRLDPDRKSAVENTIKEHPELKTELEYISEGVRYCQHLAKTKVSAKHIDDLVDVKPWVRIAFEKMLYRNWPEPLRWGAEALVISVVAVTIAIFVPWRSFHFELPKHEDKVVTTIQQENAKVVSEENLKETEATTTTKEETKKPEVQVSTQPESKAVAAVSQKDSSNVVERLKQVSQEKVIPSKGLLYQISMRVENDPKITTNVKDKIVSLGGEKAGQVDLGWRKTAPSGSYYHFTLPETHYAELVKTLGEYGPVRIYKNPHPRVMPAGQIRIILWLEDKIQPEKPVKSEPSEADTQPTTQEESGASQGQ